MHSDAVYDLIKSLSEGEKRDFRGRSSGFGYLDLFDVLDRQPAYDEEKVRDGLGSSPYARHMSYWQELFVRQLLESLRILHGKVKPYPMPEVVVSEYGRIFTCCWVKDFFTSF
ncbi:MAG: hypothetical protein IPG32_14565 [Saprospirales bacterium]|nr:hypothetical protein [Saprospirales bacterium]